MANARRQDDSFERLVGVIVIDHGSRRAESNAALLDIVRLFEQTGRYQIVEPAHMELAEPSLQTAFDRCVERGAKRVIVNPYFLLPGRHWRQDIPKLAERAARRHSDVAYLVTAPLGLHPLMTEIMHDRISHCVDHADGKTEACDVCADAEPCQNRVFHGK